MRNVASDNVWDITRPDDKGKRGGGLVDDKQRHRGRPVRPTSTDVTLGAKRLTSNSPSKKPSRRIPGTGATPTIRRGKKPTGHSRDHLGSYPRPLRHSSRQPINPPSTSNFTYFRLAKSTMADTKSNSLRASTTATVNKFDADTAYSLRNAPLVRSEHG